MKKLLAGTALALVAGWPVLAQEASDTTKAPSTDTNAGATIVLFLADVQDPIFASELIGMDVYSSEADYGGYGDEMVSSGDRSQWDDIGEVNDIVMSPAGEARGVLVDIGGFLGMGEHTVALNMDQIHLLRDENNARFVAVNSTREELENAPEYQRPAEETAAATGANGIAPADTTAIGSTASNAPAATAPGAMGSRPEFEREGYVNANYEQLIAEQLQGASVYDANDENVGDVEELIVSDGGQIQQAVIDVGGFLGMGAHRIAISFEEMQVMTNTDGNDVQIYIDQTREGLEQRPEYEG